MNHPMDEVSRRFRETCAELKAQEERVVKQLAARRHIARNPNQDFDTKMTFGARMADKIAAFGGSWTFIFIFFGLLAAWVVLNSVVLARHAKAFDPYPYILLNLILSMLASIQAPVIMMSQNRQAAKDRSDAEHDYEVNLKAELEILGLHEKLDTLRESQWADLIAMQQKQIELLTRLLDERAKNEGLSAGT